MRYGKIDPQGKVIDHWQLLHESDFEDTDTKLLLHLDNDVVDYAKGATVTNTGVTFDTSVWKFGSHSALFNAASDLLSVPDSADWQLDAGVGSPFTLDFWVRFSAIDGNTSAGVRQYASGTNHWIVYASSTNIIFYNYASSAYTVAFRCSWSPSATTWYHIVLSRVDATNAATGWRIFINGVSQTLSLDGGAWNGVMSNFAAPLEILGDTNGVVSSWLDEIRIVKGTAKWTTNFTPLTAPYLGRTTTYSITADRNTVLLVSGQGANGATTIIDECGHVPTNPGLTISTAQYKFGASSIRHNGTQAYYYPDSPDWTFGTNDWTVDLWVRFDSLTIFQSLIMQYAASNWWRLSKDDNAGGNKLRIDALIGGVSVGAFIMTNAWSGATADTWYHLAFVRSGSTAYMFINGVSQAVTTTTAFGNWSDVSGELYVSGPADVMTGYMADMRVTKGLARWTSNFTPPLVTTALINGDVDEEYKLVTELSGAPSDALYAIRFNSDSGANYGYQRLYGLGTAAGANRYTSQTLIYLNQSYVGSGEVCLNETCLYAKSGYIRTLIVGDASSVSGTTVEATYLSGCVWNNTTAPLASWALFSDISNGLGLGSKVILYRKVNS